MNHPVVAIPVLAELPWNDPLVQVGDDATLRLVLGGVPVLDVRVLLPGWSASAPVVEHDTVSQRFTLGESNALVRHTLGAVWHLGVDIHLSAESVPLMPDPLMPELHLDAGTPSDVGAPEMSLPAVWLLSGGVLGHAICALPDGTHLHWRQLAGDCDVVAPVEGATDPNTGDARVLRLLAPGASGPMTHRLRWRAEHLDAEHHPARQLPTWLPADTVLDAGEELVLDLPDAAISSDRVECGVLGERTIVPVPVGHQVVSVAQAGGVTRLGVTGVLGMADDLAARARRIVGGTDPRAATGVDLWLALHARQAVDVDDFLTEAADEVAAATSRRPVPDPFAVAALAALSGSMAEGSDLAQVAVNAVWRWHDLLDAGATLPAGACLAAAWVRMACRQLDVRCPGSLGIGSPGSADLSASPGAGLAELEQAIVTGDAARGPGLARRWRPLLGPDIPGEPARPDEALLTAALLRLVPPAWNDPADGHSGLDWHLDLSTWERRLRADPTPPGDRWAAWLHW